ncbi:MAG TPA: hypothetical protein VL522_15085 [Bordetella sp.]|nr:hypothetical protein [Bordetella sp.]
MPARVFPFLNKSYLVKAWNGLAARAETPPEITQRISKELSAILAMDDVKKRYIDLDIIAKYGSARILRGTAARRHQKMGRSNGIRAPGKQ